MWLLQFGSQSYQRIALHSFFKQKLFCFGGWHPLSWRLAPISNSALEHPTRVSMSPRCILGQKMMFFKSWKQTRSVSLSKASTLKTSFFYFYFLKKVAPLLLPLIGLPNPHLPNSWYFHRSMKQFLWKWTKWVWGPTSTSLNIFCTDHENMSEFWDNS